MKKITFLMLGLSTIFLLSFTFRSRQYTEYGIATFYSDLFDGRQTASGEKYSKVALTAAHKSLGFQTVVRVTRLDNKKSVLVRINDRGAFNKGRIIDLSKAAAAKLGMLGDGKANVKVEVVENAAKNAPVVNVSPKERATIGASAKTNTTKGKAKGNPKGKAKKGSKKVAKATPKAKSKYHVKGKKAKAAIPSERIVTGKNYKEFDLYKVQVIRPAKEGFGVQVGLLENYDNVFKFIADLQADFFKNILMSVEEGKVGSRYRVILGPFPTREQAQSYRNSLARKKKINGFVINLDNLSKAEK